ncbi:MAG: hypothetical protein JOZ16_08630, partial [Methylobacteriaceae bacterium]|nr:hypothetical protein [Methylobacteriaceae bacterium]
EAAIVATLVCEGRGTFFIAAKPLLAAVERFAGSTVTMKLGDGGTIVTSGRSRMVMRGSEDEALPVREIVADEHINMAAADVVAGFHATTDAVLDDLKRPYLGGVYMHDGGHGPAFVAMDGNRIHASAMDGNRIHAQAILPKRLVSLILATITEEANARFTFDARGVQVEFGAYRITSGLINGQFPDYAPQFTIPTTRTLKARANELLTDLDLVATVSSVKDRDIRLDLGAICEASAYRQAGQGFESGAIALEVDYSGAPLAVGFQMRLISDALLLFGKDEIEWRFGGPTDPSFITSLAHPGLETLVSPFMLAPEHRRVAA